MFIQRYILFQLFYTQGFPPDPVSLGGDSDTLACITGGIAEAYYKEIPRSIAEQVVKPFPKIFNKILDAVRKETVYGVTCKIADKRFG